MQVLISSTSCDAKHTRFLLRVTGVGAELEEASKVEMGYLVGVRRSRGLFARMERKFDGWLYGKALVSVAGSGNMPAVVCSGEK